MQEAPRGFVPGACPYEVSVPEPPSGVECSRPLLSCGSSNRALAKPQRNVGDFDCSGEDIERDWVARTGCWSRTERVLLTYDQMVAYELPATEGKHGDPRRPSFALSCRGPRRSLPASRVLLRG